jgi:hypothetical protein
LENGHHNPGEKPTKGNTKPEKKKMSKAQTSKRKEK